MTCVGRLASGIARSVTEYSLFPRLTLISLQENLWQINCPSLLSSGTGRGTFSAVGGLRSYISPTLLSRQESLLGTGSCPSPCRGAREHEGKFCERYHARKTAEFAVARMAEFLSRRRANRSWALLGRLSRFERMESGPCGLCPDFRRFGRGRDADSRGSGDRRSASQAGIACGEPRHFGCRGVPPHGASKTSDGICRTVPHRWFRSFSRAHSCSYHTRDCWGRCFRQAIW